MLVLVRGSFGHARFFPFDQGVRGHVHGPMLKIGGCEGLKHVGAGWTDDSLKTCKIFPSTVPQANHDGDGLCRWSERWPELGGGDLVPGYLRTQAYMVCSEPSDA